MHDKVIIALFAAAPSTILMAALWIHTDHLLRELHVMMNSRLDEVVRLSNIVARAEGLAAGKQEGLAAGKQEGLVAGKQEGLSPPGKGS